MRIWGFWFISMVGHQLEQLRELNTLQNESFGKGKGNDMVVVVSAMGKTTDHLVEMSKEIAINPTNEMD